MEFDVIVGNPPYQQADGGGEGYSAVPLYHRFVLAAIALTPRAVVFIVPSRWFAGGKGLADFRRQLLTDDRLSVIHDFPKTADCFPTRNIRGGVCFFLWARDHHGPTVVVAHHPVSGETDIALRCLLEPRLRTFIRYNRAVPILRAVRAFGEATLDRRVAERNHFGVASNFLDFTRMPDDEHTLRLYRNRRGLRDPADKIVYCSPSAVGRHVDEATNIKVLLSKVSPGLDEFPQAVVAQPIVATPPSVCTETYLVMTCRALAEAEHLAAYLRTRFCRFLLQLAKPSQNISRRCFALVPVQDFSMRWTDDALYAKYNLAASDVEFIESLIRPMEPINGI